VNDVHLLVVCVCGVVVLRKLVVFGVTELSKNEQASAFMKLVFERLEQFLNASMCYSDMLFLQNNVITMCQL